MIRIDLGKDGLSKTSASASVKNFFEKLKTGGFKATGPKGSKINLDLKLIIIVGIVTAVACLPHLFVAQYRSYIESQHESQMRVLKEKQEALKQEIAKYQSYQRELESYEKQKKLIQERLAIVRQLLESRGAPVNVLDSIGQSLPPRSWLSSIDFKSTPELVGGAGGPGVTLAGQAYSNEDISDFVDKLSESVHLTDVSLENVANLRVEKEIDVKVFEVKALLKGAATESVKVELPKAEPEPVRATTSSPQTANPKTDP